MFKMEIKNLQGTMIGGAIEETEAKLIEYYNEQKAKGHLGKVSGYYPAHLLNDAEKAQALDINNEGFEALFLIPDQFTYTIEPYDNPYAEAMEDRLRAKDQNFGSIFMSKVVNLNSKKFKNDQLSIKDLNDMDGDAMLLKIERAAWRGDVKALKMLVENYSGPYYSAEDKTYLVGLVNGYLVKRGQ